MQRLLNVLVTSDYHIGSYNSRFGNSCLRDELLQHFKTADCVVLAGDFLDLVYIQLRRMEGESILPPHEIIERAESLIYEHLVPILEECPSTVFLYLTGNRELGDRNQIEGIMPIFDRLAERYPLQFRCFSKDLKIADFLVTHSHLHVNGSQARTPEALCPILDSKLQLHYEHYGIKGVISGHTHLPFFGHEHNGRRYYNTGAMLKGATPLILELKIDGGLINGTVIHIGQINISERSLSLE